MREEIRVGLRRQFQWLDWLDDVAKKIIDTLYEKEVHYRGSWQKRGGPGAFMMLGRKWDRIEAICERNGYDIFKALRENDGDIGDDVDDLIGYLLLVRAESRRRAATTEYTTREEAVVESGNMELPEVLSVLEPDGTSREYHVTPPEEDLYSHLMKPGRNGEDQQ